jgi:leucyl/phenylalanyl-tRNA--protein transferase
MFYLEPNASKVALYYLTNWCAENEFHFIDAQQSTGHLKSLGAVDIPRDEFLERLKSALRHPTLQQRWRTRR